MIYGIGTDICDVRRIRAGLERHGDRFAEKVLAAGELATWRERSARWPERGVRYLATRFSAKEAFSKAIGMGMRMPMTWRDCEVAKLPSGQPVIVLHGALKAWFESQGLRCHLSVTDESDYAASFCVVERGDPGEGARPDAVQPLRPEPPCRIPPFFLRTYSVSCMTADIEHAPLILDIAGTALTPADRRRLAHPLTGGIILFARNWENRAQLLELTASIKAVRDDLLICVDHEGGRVQRFRTDGFTHLPPMRALGALWMDDGREGPGTGAMRAMDAASAVGYVLASELRACGVDFSFAPVLDLDWPSGGDGSAGSASASSVIGDRAFHRDPRVVAMLAKSVAHGMLKAGMAHCGKHFPGHGFVAADSHTDIPVDRRHLGAILANDAAPYAWLSNTLAGVMPAHVIYPRVDRLPAGFSRRWLQDILRQRLRFGGAVFSDDLSMEGARRIDGAVVDFATATLAALDAGCDLVLLCNQSLVGEGREQGRALDDVLDALERARGEGRWRPSPDSEARRLALLPQTLPHPWDELMLEPDYLRALDCLP